MKNIPYLIAAIAFIALTLGCNHSNEGHINSNSIVGKWQNLTTPSNSVEFTESKEYIVWINGETYNRSHPIRYNYDHLSNSPNFTLKEPELDTDSFIKGDITFLDTENIKISILGKDNEIVSYSEYKKIN